jgi:hypothetical protein
MFTSPSLPLAPLDQAKRRIQHASLAAFLAAALTVFVSLSTAWDLKSVEPLQLLGDAAWVMLLGLGIKRKSRVCAAVLVIYWVIAKWILWQETPPGPVGIFVGLSFWFAFIGGLGGAIFFHRHQGRERDVSTEDSSKSVVN